MIGAALAAAAAAGAIAHGAFHRNSPVFGRALWRLPATPDTAPAVSLTFDDGPNPEATPRILDALARAGVLATFFGLGRHVERWPAIVARASEAGHEIANHGYYHRKLHRRTPAYVRDDLTRGMLAVEHATGLRPRFFRAPHGFRSPWVSAIAKSLGERTVGWTLGVWDSARPGEAEIVRRTLDGVSPRCILLLHDGDGYDPHGDRSQTAAALPAILRELSARGYRFEPLPASTS